MDFALAELLSREEILKILGERKLKILDIESLPNDELLRIYKTFAVPLARREPKTIKSNFSAITSNIAPSAASRSEQDKTKCALITLKRKGAAVPMETDNLNGRVAAAAVEVEVEVEVKRPRFTAAEISNQPLGKTRARSPTEDCLSIVTKRCKISWP